jgi:hypothetical protein
MRQILLAGALTLAASFAATAAPLSQTECNTLWNQVNPSGAATITQTQSQPYVTDFKAADPDNDGTLTKSEFSSACKSGYVTAMAGPSGGSKMAPNKQYQ